MYNFNENIDVNSVHDAIINNSVPNFLGIGFPKTGTTWMHESLKSHPDIFIPEHPHVKFKKELNFWSSYRGGKALNSDEYFRLFSNKSQKITGEFSVTYTNPQVLVQIKKLLNDVKIICGFRNPVDCIISSHLHQLRNSPDKNNINFFDYYENNKIFLENTYNYDKTFFLCEDLFKENFFYYFYKDLKLSPLKLIQNTYKFLNVDNDFQPKTIKHRINSRYEFKSRLFHRLVSVISKKFDNKQSLIAPTYRSIFIIRLLLKLNKSKPRKIDSKISKFLIDIYKPKCKFFLDKFSLDINLPF